MRIKIEDRQEFVHYTSNHYCKNCAHRDECPLFYLCPPLQEQWDEEEEFRKRYAEEEE